MTKEVVLDCCNDPKHGVSNCPTLIKSDKGFTLRGDDGQQVDLTDAQLEKLIAAGQELLDED